MENPNYTARLIRLVALCISLVSCGNDDHSRKPEKFKSDTTSSFQDSIKLAPDQVVMEIHRFSEPVSATILWEIQSGKGLLILKKDGNDAETRFNWDSKENSTLLAKFSKMVKAWPVSQQGYGLHVDVWTLKVMYQNDATIHEGVWSVPYKDAAQRGISDVSNFCFLLTKMANMEMLIPGD